MTGTEKCIQGFIFHLVDTGCLGIVLRSFLSSGSSDILGCVKCIWTWPASLVEKTWVPWRQSCSSSFAPQYLAQPFAWKWAWGKNYFLEKYFYKTEWYSDYQLRLPNFWKVSISISGLRGNLLLFFILIFFRASLLQSCFIAEKAFIKRSFTISTIKIHQTESQLIYPVLNNLVSTTIAKVHCINNQFSSKGVRIN